MVSPNGCVIRSALMAVSYGQSKYGCIRRSVQMAVIRSVQMAVSDGQSKWLCHTVSPNGCVIWSVQSEEAEKLTVLDRSATPHGLASVEWGVVC